MKFKLINPASGIDAEFTNRGIAKFLHTHLGEYRDDEENILKAIEYVFQENRGGLILLGLDGAELIGAVIINKTGMSGYIPENILVYVAVHKDRRGSGVGKELMKQVIRLSEGGIALHVEPDNPAVHLYKRLGFTSKYLEMRLPRP